MIASAIRTIKVCLFFACIVMSVSCSNNVSEISAAPANVGDQKPGFTVIDGAAKDLGLDPQDVNLDESSDSGTWRLEIPSSQFSDAGLLVALNAEIADQYKAGVQQTLWTQIEGSLAAIYDPYELNTNVMLPDLSEPEVLVFRLSTVDDQQHVRSAITKVTVFPLQGVLQVSSVSTSESNGQISFTVNLSEPAATDLVFNYFTENASAVAGRDYEAVSSTLVFAAGETQKNIAVNILQDDFREGSEQFILRIQSVVEGAPSIVATSIGSIVDTQDGPINSYVPLDEGIADLAQADLGGTAGAVRFNLEWSNENTDINLHVTDPCENDLAVQSPDQICQNSNGIWEGGVEGELVENIVWLDSVAGGVYSGSVEHIGGEPTDYVLRIYFGEQSKMFTGTLANGQILDVFDFTIDTVTPINSNSSSSSSSTSSSSSSSTSTSSSNSSSSSSSSSATSSSSSSSSSSSGVAIAIDLDVDVLPVYGEGTTSFSVVASVNTGTEVANFLVTLDDEIYANITLDPPLNNQVVTLFSVTALELSSGENTFNITATADGAIAETRTLSFIVGTAGEDTLSATGSHSNVWVSGAGGDQIIGSANDDAYYFNLGNDQLDIVEQGISDSDRLVFGEGIYLENLLYARQGDNLIFAVSDTADTVTIQDWYLGRDRELQSVQFGVSELFDLSLILELDSIVGPNIQPATLPLLFLDTPISTVFIVNSGGGEIISCDGSLTAGLTVAVSSDQSTCEISGSPTQVQATSEFVIRATNVLGSSTAVVTIGVASATPDLLAPVDSTFTLLEPIAPVLFVNQAGENITVCESEPALPVGLIVTTNEDNTTCLITGTPTQVSPINNYVVSASNSYGVSEATIGITVADLIFTDELVLPFNATATAGIGIVLSEGVARVDWNDGSEVVNVTNQDLTLLNTIGAGRVTHDFDGSTEGSVTVSFSKGLQSLIGLSSGNTAIPFTFDFELLTGAVNLDTFVCNYSSCNISTDIATLSKNHPNLVSFQIAGTGSTNGDIADLPSKLEVFRVSTPGAITGSLKDLSSNIIELIFSNTLDNNVSGLISDIPDNLVRLSISGSNTISGNIENIHENIFSLSVSGNNIISGDLTKIQSSGGFSLDIRGKNTITGNIAEMPANIMGLFISGSNTLYGDISTLPLGIKSFWVEGDNTISGDLGRVENSNTDFTIFVSGQNTLTGNLADLPEGLGGFFVRGNNTIYGNIQDIPSTVRQMQIQGQNTISGDIGLLLNATIFQLEVYGLNTIAGNIGAITADRLSTFRIGGANSIQFTESENWSVPPFRQFSLFGSGEGMSSAAIDSLLILFGDTLISTIGTRSISLSRGADEPRTAKSDAAVADLEARGFSVTSNVVVDEAF